MNTRVPPSMTDGLLTPAAIGDSVQARSTMLDAIAALSPANDDIIQWKSGAPVNRTPAQLKADMAIGAGLTGPVSSTNNNPAVFDGTSGGALKEVSYATFKTSLSLVKGDVGLGNVDNTSDTTKWAASATLTNKTINASNNTISNLTTAMFAANVIDTDTSLTANSNTRIASQAAVKAYADARIEAANALQYKGTIACAANPNYPAASAGHMYIVSSAGKIGGGSGLDVEVGDALLCLTDGTAAGTHASVGAQWSILQFNLVGALTAANIGASVQAYHANLTTWSGKAVPAGAVVGTSDTQTLTGKTIDAASNTISNLVTSMFAANVVDTDVTMAADSDTRLASQKAVRAYVAANGGSGDLVLLDTQTPSASSGVSFVSGFSTDYDHYIFVFEAVQFSSAVLFNATVSINAGSSFLATGYAAGRTEFNGSAALSGGTGSTAVTLVSTASGAGNAVSGMANLIISGNDVSIDSRTGHNGRITVAHGRLAAGGRVNGVRFAPGGGTFTGTIKMLGVKK